ncbi:hypothetical protein [Metallosphaera yellowstonensis]|nr:hypothetical protein [Metallosphaera yellowstonensis]
MSAPRYRKDKDTKESKLLVAVRQDRYVVESRTSWSRSTSASRSSS